MNQMISYPIEDILTDEDLSRINEVNLQHNNEFYYQNQRRFQYPIKTVPNSYVQQQIPVNPCIKINPNATLRYEQPNYIYTESGVTPYPMTNYMQNPQPNPSANWIEHSDEVVYNSPSQMETPYQNPPYCPNQVKFNPAMKPHFPTSNAWAEYPRFHEQYKVHPYVDDIPFDRKTYADSDLFIDEPHFKKHMYKRKYDHLEEDLDIPKGFKLPASKSPIMEAMVYCAIKKWGIDILECQDETPNSQAKVVFKILDFEQYYKYSCAICSKQNPTEDIGSRVKSLRRWFVNFPKKRDRRDNPQFTLEVKPEVSKKVHDMIEKYKCLIDVRKRRRTK
jgi:hypothetical protein